MVEFQKKWFLSNKSCCIRAKWSLSHQLVVFGKKLLYFGKVAVIGQSGGIRVKWLYSGGVVVFGKVVVFGHMCFHSGKVVVFGQKVLYLVKFVVFRQKWLYFCKS